MSIVDKRPVCLELYEALKKRDIQGKLVVSDIVLQRFAQKVKIMPSGCWEWIGSKHPLGYGLFEIAGVDSKRASRMSWMFFRSTTIKGDMCHYCDNPPCINPDHLWEGTPSENAIDSYRKGRGKNQFSRVNRSDVLKIRVAVGTCKGLGRRFGVSPQTISDIKTRKSWAWLESPR